MFTLIHLYKYKLNTILRFLIEDETSLKLGKSENKTFHCLLDIFKMK